MLVLSLYIEKHELKPLQKYIKIEDLKDGARKVLKGLGQKISVSNSDFHFYKVRIGSAAKGRMIVFLVSKSKRVVPILIRLKKDKKFGMNMAANNPHVVDQVNKNLSHVLKNIKEGNFRDLDL